MPRHGRRVGSLLSVLLACALSCLGLASMPALAETDLGSLDMLSGAGDASPVPQGLVLGGVFIGSNARYQGQDDTALLIPGAVYFGERFMYLGDRARYYFRRDGGFAAFAYGRVRFGNLDPAEVPELAGMKKREWEPEAGIGANLITPYALLTMRAATDISGTSKGQECLLWSDFPVVRDRLLVMPGLGVLWRSSKLANYYFGGVSAEEARPGRPQHDTGATWSPMVSLVTTYRFDRHWMATLTGNVEFFDSGTAQSPIVGHDNEVTVIAGVGYVW
ncbi:MipA/OmpV family protein [Niveibacterium umoris]|uniref:Outer membrane protein n=1 Tax=Niveibacterium umoris TaxID=1193620 RepID=A0A840BTI0_9RHOO|nr:MipA/OmpV family protein [Niveibacterium umoris]MBB4013667.1 outer membrane protein [Niveibacterium umoris]